MARNVDLDDDAYEALARLREPGQSFSDVVRELTDNPRPKLEDVLPSPSKAEVEHWEAFQENRRQARQDTRGRVDLKG